MKAQQSQNFIAQLVFDRTNATFKPEQTITGNVKLVQKSNAPFKVDIASLLIIPTGKLSLHARHGNKKIQQILKDVQEISMLNIQPLELAKNKTLQIQISYKIQNLIKYIETYIGVYINVAFQIEVAIKFMNNFGTVADTFPFYIQVSKQGRETIQNFIYPKKKNFMIGSGEIKGEKIPKFKIRGQIDSQICYFTDDLNGSIVVDQAESPIRSIDVQMYRIQKITPQNGNTITQRTQIQMIQMCDGDVTRNMQLPIYMILPRYYSCPSFKYKWAEVNFEVDLLIIFRNGFKVTANIPLKLIRS